MANLRKRGRSLKGIKKLSVFDRKLFLNLILYLESSFDPETAGYSIWCICWWLQKIA